MPPRRAFDFVTGGRINGLLTVRRGFLQAETPFSGPITFQFRGPRSPGFPHLAYMRGASALYLDRERRDFLFPITLDREASSTAFVPNRDSIGRVGGVAASGSTSSHLYLSFHTNAEATATGLLRVLQEAGAVSLYERLSVLYFLFPRVTVASFEALSPKIGVVRAPYDLSETSCAKLRNAIASLNTPNLPSGFLPVSR